jgi:hypothetical protein
VKDGRLTLLGLIRDVGRALVALVTGGVLAAAVAVYEHIVGNSVSGWKAAVLAAVLFCLAFWQVVRSRSARIAVLENENSDLKNQLTSTKPKVLLEFRSTAYIPSSLAVVNVKGDDATRINFDCDLLPRVNTIERLTDGEWKYFVVAETKGPIQAGNIFTVESLIELDWKPGDIVRIPVRLRWKDADWTDYASLWDLTYDTATKNVDVELKAKPDAA